ncbi:hypothetical protein DFH08DRAFT_795980 [Mycena albidolilacea]|uniref:Uncharacterized protein n=1 Tax=Mycena albidolilacea TaxID=1033008 RepID=A0AAD7F5V7_9AGAR|nr:hypothetical protein DFH08DRAFT_795980 [Mycena albidolilacea]
MHHRYDRVRTLAHKHKGLLTLVDSNNELGTLPNGLVSLPVRIVQATSPLEDRFKEWSKHAMSLMHPSQCALSTSWCCNADAVADFRASTAPSPLEVAQWTGSVARRAFNLHYRELGLDLIAETQQDALAVLMKDPIVTGALQSHRVDERADFYNFFIVRRETKLPLPFPAMVPQSSWATIHAASPLSEESFKRLFWRKTVTETLLEFASKSAPNPQIARAVYEAAAIQLLASVAGVVYRDGVSSRGHGGMPSPTSHDEEQRQDAQSHLVETLLIPMQRATSDTCTDEEKGAMVFTAERAACPGMGGVRRICHSCRMQGTDVVLVLEVLHHAVDPITRDDAGVVDGRR